jgi:transposase-like protein
VIATMTSVALDCEVSAQQVRDWRKEDKRQE